MAVTPEIKTKFTLDGLKQASVGLRGFGTQTKSTFASVKLASSKALEPFQKDIEKSKKSLATLQSASLTAGRVGFGGLQKSASLAFKGITIGAAGAVTAIAGISAAAVSASRDTAAELDKLSKDSRRLGVSTEDLSVLNFAATREGVDTDEIVNGIATISSEFLAIRKSIADANSEYDDFLQNTRRQVSISLKGGDRGGAQSALDALSGARSSSLQAIQARQAQLEDMLARGAPMENYSLATQSRMQSWRQQLAEMKKAEADLKASFGPAGEALFGLEQYGIDIEKAAKGGITGFTELSDAIRKVQDPSERLRYSMLLFGEDAGPKMLPLLEGGRKAIEDYRKELERLGGVVTKADAQIGTAYQDSAENFRRSIGGVKLAVSREVLPLLTETNIALTEWTVKNRQRIASFMKDAFVGTRNLATDAIDAFNGKRSDFRTGWLNTAAEKIKEIREYVSGLKDELSKLADGGSTRWPWINSMRDGVVEVRDFVLDVFKILRGEDASKFQWLNDLRDGVVDFATSFKDAFDLFAETLQWIRDTFIKPIADLFGMNVTTLALYIGLAKFTGLLGAATTAVGLLFKAVGGLFALGGGGGALASAVAGIAGAAGAGRVAAAGAGVAASAGAGAGAGVVAGSGLALARTIALRASVPATAAYLGYDALTQEPSEFKGPKIGLDDLIRGQISDFRKRKARVAEMDAKNKADREWADYWVKYDSVGLDEQRQMYFDRYKQDSRDPTRNRGMTADGLIDTFGVGQNGKMDAYGVRERVKETININFNGRSVATVEADPLNSRRLSQGFYQIQQGSY